MGSGNDVGSSLMDCCMDDECSSVDNSIPLNDFTGMVDQNKVRDADLAETHRKWVDPNGQFAQDPEQ